MADTMIFDGPENHPDKVLEKVAQEEATLDAEACNVLNNSGSPQDIYAGFFRLYVQQFKAGVNTLSNKKLKRLIKALVEHPLNEKEIRLMDPMEKQLFVISDRLIQAKYGMIIHSLSERAEKENNQNTITEDNKNGSVETNPVRADAQEQTNRP